jgi:hypothetical protein
MAYTPAATIRLRGEKGHQDEKIAGGTIKPGHMIRQNSSDQVVVHSTYGGRASRIFAIEDSLQGNLATTSYASGDLVFTYQALPGDVIQARVPSGGVAPVNGDFMVSNGDGTLVKSVLIANDVLYSTTAASTAVAGDTSGAQTGSGATFDVGYTIPANSLQVGDVIHVKVAGRITAQNSTDTFKISIMLGSTAVAITGTIDAATDDIFVLETDLIIRTIGASGTFVADGYGFIGTAAAAASAADIGAPTYLASTAIDTTTTNALTAKALISVNSSGNSCRVDQFIVSLGRTSQQYDIVAVCALGSDTISTSSEAFCPVRII